MMTAALDKIWAEVTSVKGKKVTLIEPLYKKELARLKSRQPDPVQIFRRKTIHLGKAIDNTRSNLRLRIGVDRRESTDFDNGKSLLDYHPNEPPERTIQSRIRSSSENVLPDQIESEILYTL